jgi:hypothetical protein
MNISKQEAQDSLNEIQDVIAQTRRTIGMGPTGIILILWGLIWVAGYSCSQFSPGYARMAWPVLIMTGSISSAVAGSRNRNSVRSSNGGRIGIFWLVLFAYAILWMILLHPQLPSGAEWVNYQPMNDRQVGAFFATVPMFAYVVGGLWLGRFFVWLGAIVTALTVAGFFLLPGWFNLWMAFTGGGSLIVAGLFIRKFWR